MGLSAAALAAFCCFALAAHMISVVIVLVRDRGRKPLPLIEDAPGVTILRPVCGLENNLEETLASTFSLTYPRYEILFCISSRDDGAIGLVERLIADNPMISARLLIGADVLCANPKLNNLSKGWRSARYAWIAMSDSNVLLPRDYVESLFSRWTPSTGLVSSPPVGIRPQGFWAEVECAFLNAYQARWQLAADQVGLGFAQGKNLFWRRDILDAAGGVGALANEAAEDAAATKLVHKAGLKVRLTRMPFAQPLGRRTFTEVWARQLRWARLRRATFPAAFAPEILSGGLVPLGAATLLAAQTDVTVGWVLPLVVVWYGAEYALARAAGWPSSAQAILAGVLRDLILPAIWLGAWAGNGIVWRGNSMAANDRTSARRRRDPWTADGHGAKGAVAR